MVFDQLMGSTKLRAKQNTGIKKYEKGKRSNCMVDFCSNLMVEMFIINLKYSINKIGVQITLLFCLAKMKHYSVAAFLSLSLKTFSNFSILGTITYRQYI